MFQKQTGLTFKSSRICCGRNVEKTGGAVIHLFHAVCRFEMRPAQILTRPPLEGRGSLNMLGLQLFKIYGPLTSAFSKVTAICLFLLFWGVKFLNRILACDFRIPSAPGTLDIQTRTW